MPIPDRQQHLQSTSTHLAFDGFDPPQSNNFRMPLEWIDISAGIDNLAELKVVQYILRHTWGFQEYGIKRRLTVDEFMHGRKRKDGSRMDKGTGLSERSVYNALEKAREHGYIDEDRDETDRARIKKYYSLKMRSVVEPDEEPVPSAVEGDLQIVQPEVQTLHPDPARLAPRTEEPTPEPTFEQQQGADAPAQSEGDTEPRGSAVVVSGSIGKAAGGTPSVGPQLDQSQQLTTELTRRGVGQSTAAMLVRDVRPELLREKLAFFDWLKRRKPQRITGSSGGFLSEAIRNDYPVDEEYLRYQEQQARRAQAKERRDESDAMALYNEALRMARPVEEQAEAYLKGQDVMRRHRREGPLVGRERAAEKAAKLPDLAAAQATWFAGHPEYAYLLEEAKAEAEQGSEQGSKTAVCGDQNRPENGPTPPSRSTSQPTPIGRILPGVLAGRAPVPDETQVPVGGGRVAG